MTDPTNVAPPRGSGGLELPEDLEVVRHLEVDLDADELWDLVVDDDERSAWWGGPTTLDVTPGGRGHATDELGRVRRIVVDQVDDPAEGPPDDRTGGASDRGAPRRLAFRWWPEDGGPASSVELVVAPTPTGSRLTVTETRPAPFRLTMCAGRLVDLELLVLRHVAPGAVTVRCG